LFIDTYFSLPKFSTTLKEPLNFDDTIVVLSGAESLPEYGWVTIGGFEVIKYTSISGTDTLSGLERTSPENWELGTLVDQRYNADVINNLINELK